MKLTTPEAPVRGLRIFVVEDHPDTITYLAMYLRASGHAVEHAPNVREAIARLRKEHGFDVLLSDLNLPDGDGWRLMDELRKHECAPPVSIAMSGFGMGADKAKSAAAGFSLHLVKPLNPDELDHALESARERLASHTSEPPAPRRARTTPKRQRA